MWSLGQRTWISWGRPVRGPILKVFKGKESMKTWHVLSVLSQRHRIRHIWVMMFATSCELTTAKRNHSLAFQRVRISQLLAWHWLWLLLWDFTLTGIQTIPGSWHRSEFSGYFLNLSTNPFFDHTNDRTASLLPKQWSCYWLSHSASGKQGIFSSWPHT